MRPLILLLGALLLVGCDRPSDDYFPLQEGLHWNYRVTVEQPHRSATRTLQIESLAERDFKGEAVGVRRTSHGTDYLIARRADGLYRVAKRRVVELQPQADATPRMVLPLPSAESKGRVWSSITMPYLIERVYEGGHNQYASGLRFPMTYTLAALDETVTVPAGRFEHCLLVVGEASLNLYADPRTGNHAIEITTREWYAPGVGLVKLERDEPLDTDVYKGGRMTFELLSVP